MKIIQKSTYSNNGFDYFILLFLVIYFCGTVLDTGSALITGDLDEEPYWNEKIFLYIDLGLLITSGACIFLMLSKFKEARPLLFSLILYTIFLIIMGVARRIIYHGEAAGYMQDISPFFALMMAVYTWKKGAI